MRKQFLELPIELTSQGFVMRKDQGWTVDPCYDICHRKCLTCTGSTFQYLFALAFLQTFHKGIDGIGLITSRFEF